jgi:hypothetical protein
MIKSKDGGDCSGVGTASCKDRPPRPEAVYMELALISKPCCRNLKLKLKHLNNGFKPINNGNGAVERSGSFFLQDIGGSFQ